LTHTISEQGARSLQSPPDSLNARAYRCFHNRLTEFVGKVINPIKFSVDFPEHNQNVVFLAQASPPLSSPLQPTMELSQLLAA
jgi:hypothetical protein